MEKQQLQQKKRSLLFLLLIETRFTQNEPLIHYKMSGYQTIELNPRKTSIREGGIPYAETGVQYEVLQCESELEIIVAS